MHVGIECCCDVFVAEYLLERFRVHAGFVAARRESVTQVVRREVRDAGLPADPVHGRVVGRRLDGTDRTAGVFTVFVISGREKNLLFPPRRDSGKLMFPPVAALLYDIGCLRCERDGAEAAEGFRIVFVPLLKRGMVAQGSPHVEDRLLTVQILDIVEFQRGGLTDADARPQDEEKDAVPFGIHRLNEGAFLLDAHSMNFPAGCVFGCGQLRDFYPAFAGMTVDQTVGPGITEELVDKYDGVDDGGLSVSFPDGFAAAPAFGNLGVAHDVGDTLNVHVADLADPHVADHRLYVRAVNLNVVQNGAAAQRDFPLFDKGVEELVHGHVRIGTQHAVAVHVDAAGPPFVRLFEGVKAPSDAPAGLFACVAGEIPSAFVLIDAF